ncbi:MAG: TolC family protein [Acidobacteriota bacterium]
MLRYECRRPSRHLNLYFGLLLGGLCTPLASAQTLQTPEQLTLQEALQSAFANSPVLRAQRTELAQHQGGRLTAQTYPYNPQLELELADRSSLDSSTTDLGFSLSQELEVAGQRRLRTAVAERRLAASRETLRRQEQLLAAQVESAFASAVRARELLALAETEASLAREVLDFSQRRLERGATSQIEVNLARASAGRAERGVQRTRAAYAAAKSRTAELAGLEPASQPEPLGDLELPAGDLPPLEQLLQQALDQRKDLSSLHQQEQAAEAAVRLALAERRPNLTVSAFFQREESTDDIFGATLGVALPLFNRNQGAIAERRASRERARAHSDALELTIEQEVVAAWNDLRAARTAAEALRDQVLGTLEDNLDLLQRSLAAGRIAATEVVTLRREFVAARREYVEALADAWSARTRLALAIGQSVLTEATSHDSMPGKELR